MTENTEITRLKALIDGLYTGQERVNRGEIYERMVAAELPSDLLQFFDRLPEGDYEQEELVETVNQMIDEAGERGHLGQIPEV
ncbi:hypothetical protein HNP84_004048 [Thermocatellispora tengchongensis]|uniref:Uncharacterized protein n=1 Tax=Thermocatellispora tengchongensis TaxID=1073253 RepID=A0A840P6V9_9ACTN|nr:hypothetical protein [Thermocatellispora tengchongensis]MBB5134316.1 hypothetical protein [Thermocatellispora tengchongensis]